MKLRTEITVPPSPLKIDHSTPILTLGSCFSEEMGHLFGIHKFKVINNPLGTMFNPVSIADTLESICAQTYAPLSSQIDDVYLDHRFHASVFGYTSEELHEKISGTLAQAQQQFDSKKSVLLITLGTAWVYRHLTSNVIVNNCHKQDPKLFRKELLSMEQCRESLSEAFDTLLAKFPQTEIILSLSPVRHTKDGLEENQISKSILRVLCHELSMQYQQVHYFPAYEIVLDDLRDYRFYETDLIHPNAQAVSYIWSIFRQTFFNEATNALIERWTKLQHKLQHKPFYTESKNYRQFLQQTLQETLTLGKEIALEEEIAILQHKIKEG